MGRDPKGSVMLTRVTNKTKLYLSGHVDGHPDRIITHYHSKPEGFTFSELMERYAGFANAVTLTKCNLK